jgi:hypothetical protein
VKLACERTHATGDCGCPAPIQQALDRCGVARSAGGENTCIQNGYLHDNSMVTSRVARSNRSAVAVVTGPCFGSTLLVVRVFDPAVAIVAWQSCVAYESADLVFTMLVSSILMLASWLTISVCRLTEREEGAQKHAVTFNLQYQCWVASCDDHACRRSPRGTHPAACCSMDETPTDCGNVQFSSWTRLVAAWT